MQTMSAKTKCNRSAVNQKVVMSFNENLNTKSNELNHEENIVVEILGDEKVFYNKSGILLDNKKRKIKTPYIESKYIRYNTG